MIAGSIGPGHAFVHVREIGTPVEGFWPVIRPGDRIHADRHGTLVVPGTMVAKLRLGIEKRLQTERLVLDPARGADFDFEAFEQAWAEFEKALT